MQVELPNMETVTVLLGVIPMALPMPMDVAMDTPRCKTKLYVESCIIIVFVDKSVSLKRAQQIIPISIPKNWKQSTYQGFQTEGMGGKGKVQVVKLSNS